MEVEASTRLFGGKRALRDRVLQESLDLGSTGLAWAPNSLAALSLARAGIENGFKKPLDELLDGLALEVLSATAPHRTTLAQLGCRTLGDIRRLPRGGVSRRFDKELLGALDRAYGLVPEAHVWHEIPEKFHARLELMSRVELAPALLFGARRLLLQLCGWLAARHCGTTSFKLRWAHDSMRSKDAGDGGELVVRTAEPMRDIEHLCRLLAENLAKVELKAPAGDLALETLDVVALEERSGALFPDAERNGESLALVLERIAARLGPDRVLRPVLLDDHRLEWAQHWQPAPEPRPKKNPQSPDLLPQPTFVLPQPLTLAIRDNRPIYQGPLHLLSGPHRVESGWWHRVVVDRAQTTNFVTRDYWVALSEHAGVLWVYQERLADDRTAWYLHGSFA
jgi:protein ImuB